MDIDESGILLTPLKRISVENGDVLRGLKATDPGFHGFGEVYFSYIHYQAVKAWKLHKQHTANFILPLGRIKIVLHKENDMTHSSPGFTREIILSDSAEQYQRLTIAPGIWYGFQGLAHPSSLILSFLNGEHALNEQESKSVDEFSYQWTMDNA